MNTQKIATLAKQLDVLRRRHADHERSVAELERLGSKQATVIAASRDKVAKKIAAVEKQIAALQDEAEIDTVEELIVECSVTDPDALALREIHAHAAACDEHAAALASNIRALHVKIVELRQRHGGRGPAAAVVVSALERCAAKYFAGTVLRSLRGAAPRPTQGSFKDQIALWDFMLRSSPPAPTPSPSPSLSPVAAA
jgi:hypothetical protein